MLFIAPLRGAALAALACFGAPALAQITIPTVTIGSPGNPPDATTGFGSVAYMYNIGTTEVTNAQYAAFLNAKAKSDPFGLYNTNMAGAFGGITRSGSSGSYTYTTITGRENHPVTFVSFWDATRFANWLHNGQGSGDTETGAYTLNGVTNPFNPSVTRNADWLWAVTTRDEWYKAAFYQPFTAGGDSDNYWLYPTSSNSINTSQANYGNVIGNATPVGSYAANFNGTFDMAGNLREWTEAISDGVDDYRKVWGGSFDSPSDSELRPGSHADVEPIYEDFFVGFRLAQKVADRKPTWEQLASANRPSARVGYAMAYDAQRREHVLFGGDTGSGPAGDTWVWNGATWRFVASTGPSARAHPVAVFDSARNRVVLFGGRSGNTYHNDTWEWNGSTWTQVLTANAPSQRAVAGMAFDSVRNRAVLFGGNGPSGHLGDLWEYDGTNWIAKPTPPVGAREWPGLAFDSVRGVLVLFGGSPPQASQSFNDTWEWNGVTGVWSLRASGAGSPPGRGNKNLAFDPVRGVTVVLSGYAGVFRADHWEWNGSVWTQRHIAIPEARYSHVLTYDLLRSRVVTFGGEVASAELRDTTWEFDGNRWIPMSGSSPIPRFGAPRAFVPELGGAVTFGGAYAIGPQYFAVSNELWLQSASGWGLLQTNNPTSRAYSALGAIGNGQLLMFGGLVGATNTPQNDLWRFSGTTWTQLNPSNAPSPRSGAASCVFTSINRFVVFGGQSGGSLVPNAVHAIDTVNLQNWLSFAIGGPSPREDAMMAYDPVRDEAILVGGRNASRFDVDDVWRLRFASGTPQWTQMNSLGTVNSWSGGSMFWDPGRQRIMLYAKQQFGFDQNASVIPTVYEWTGTEFVPIAGEQPPSLRKYASMGPTSATGDIRLFGGLRASDSAILGDTWAFNGLAQPNFPLPPTGGGNFEVGDTVTLTLPIIIGQSPTLRWSRNGVPLSDGLTTSGSVVSGADTGTLIITNAQPADSGEYLCTATNPCGTSQSQPAEISVAAPCPADFDGSGFVDSDDFILYVSQFALGCDGPGSPDPACTKSADFDGSGFVDSDDFILFANAFDAGC